jgi:hypothetical protein
VKRRELLKRIRSAAQPMGHDVDVVREGAKHTIFRVGSVEFPVPRHSEINEYTAQAIMKDLADQLGEGWWRR